MLPACPTLLRHALRAGPLLLVGAGIALASSGCYFTDQGVDPPYKLAGDDSTGPAFYYPTGLAVSPGRSALFVANSDFDLAYNGGTIQVLDLAGVRSTLQVILDGLQAGQSAEQACGMAGLHPITNNYLTPAACTPIKPPFKGSATVGAFSSGLLLVTNPAGEGARLFVPVRGDPSITWFDVADDRKPGNTAPFELECGQCKIDDAPCQTSADCCSNACVNQVCVVKADEATGDARRCRDEHRLGLDPYDNFRDQTLPVEPVGLDADDLAQGLVSAHQLDGNFAVGLATNDFNSNRRPSFQFALTTNVGSGPTEVSHIPRPAIVAQLQDHTCWQLTPPAYQPGYLVTYNASPEVDIFRFDNDALSAPPRPFLTRAGTASITVNADGKDSRGIAVDASERRACEAACNVPVCSCSDASCPAPSQAVLACLRQCAQTPLDIYIANRSPATLLTGHVQTIISDGDTGVGSGAFDVAVINGVVPLANGPSKVGIGKVIGPDHKLHTRVFAVTFDSRFVFEYDPIAQRVDQVIYTGRGPHPIAFDACVDDCGPGESPHAYMIVGHFTDSYLGVVDLDMTHLETFGTMFASIGTPTEPRESK